MTTPTTVDYTNAAIALPEQVAWRAQHEGTIQAARDNYASDDIEIDDTPLLSPGEGGVWVSAWVWVPTADDEDDNDSTNAG